MAHTYCVCEATGRDRKHSFSEQTETEADLFSVPGGQAQGKTLQHFNFREISKILEGQRVRRGGGERAEVRSVGRKMKRRWRGRREQKAELKGRAEVQGVRGEHILVKNQQQQHHFPVTSLFETQVRHRSDNCIHAFTVRSDCGLFWRSHFLLFLFISAFL